VHIIREIMDEVRYEKRADVGMRLRMVKRLGTGNELEGADD
jgi:anti-sigma regulatory factor (Ser/Thr protein kinase)